MSSVLDSKLREHHIIPDVLNDESSISTPLYLLQVKYPDHAVAPGDSVPRASVLTIPILQCAEAEPGDGYVVLMVDPDLFKKSDQLSKDVRHWLANASVAQDGAVNITSTVSDYVPPTPAYGTGHHRYLFLLAKTSASMHPSQFATDTSDEDLKTRTGFVTSQYIKDHGLQLIAANFMEVKADAQSTVENFGLAAHSLGHTLVGK